MPDSKITELTALAGASAASGDLAVVVDVSDTSMAASGTDKKMTLTELSTAVTGLGSLATDAEVTSAVSTHLGTRHLPTQWTAGANGNVMATVDSVGATPLTIAAMSGQTGDLLKVTTIGAAASATSDDSRLSYTARTVGFAGNSITVTLVIAGLNTPLSLSEAGNTVTVNLATNGAGAATTTAAGVETIVDAQSTLVTATALIPAQVPAAGDTFLGGGVDTTESGIDRRNAWNIQTGDQNVIPLLIERPYAGGSRVMRVRAATGAQSREIFAIFPPGNLSQSAVHIDGTTGQPAALALSPDDSGDNDALRVFGSPDFNGDEYRIWNDGKFSTKATTAPADGDLSANEVAFYFDPTNGSATPRWKGKQANGTVVSGSVGSSAPSFLSVAKWS